MKKLFIEYNLIFFICFSYLFAQNSNVIDLRSANKLEGKVINNEDVRELIGNVHFVQKQKKGEVKVWCDRAIRFLTQNKIELFGNVKILRDSTIILSDEGMYFGNDKYMEGRYNVKLIRGNTLLTSNYVKYFTEEKKSLFWDNVILKEPSSTIYCSNLYYSEDETKSIATNDVKIIDNKNNINIYCDSLINIEKQHFSLALKNPRLVQIDTSDGIIDTLLIASNIMQSYKDINERFVAIDNVRIIKGETASRCEKATLYTKKDLIDLTIKPILWQNQDQITGDSIRITLKNNQLKKLWIKNHAFIASKVDSIFPNRYNQLSGKEINMYFENNELQNIFIDKYAVSFYYLFENNKPNGANKSSGDKINIFFKNGLVENIKIYKGTIGQFIPEKMILNKEHNFNLDGFRIFNNKPINNGIYIIN